MTDSPSVTGPGTGRAGLISSTDATVPVTAHTRTEVPPARAFEVIVPIDLSLIFTGWGPFPTVRGVKNQTGAWDHAGASRNPELSDGTPVTVARNPRLATAISPQMKASAAARLDPTDHAILATRVVGDSPLEIAETPMFPSPRSRNASPRSSQTWNSPRAQRDVRARAAPHSPSNALHQQAAVSRLSLVLKSTSRGLAVYLSDGRELAQCSGHGSKERSLDYVARATRILQGPTTVRRGPPVEGTC
ncbi:MAG TPA: hypothetical protein VGH93_09415, partial [Solirubrobacteraceae bacterium]